MNALLENPWPLALGLAVLGAIGLWLSQRSGALRDLAAGLALLLAAVALVVASFVIPTPGRIAEGVVAQLVADAGSGNLAGMRLAFSPHAVIRFGTNEEEHDRATIERGIESLDGANRIERNEVLELDGETIDATHALVRLACRTQTERLPGPVGVRFQLHLAQQPDGTWAIERLDFLSLMGNAPSPRVF